MAQYEWIPLYKEIAQKLLQFYGDRRPLVQLVNDIFAETGLNMPKLEQNSQLVDIDPFTVFGLFNKSSMREDKRRKILAALLQKLEISADLPANFDGIPVLNNQNATFYYFLPGRGKDDIEDLWIFYTGAMRYAVEKSERSKSCVAKSFDVVVNKKGNGNSKITMGLYWIAPDVYLNLDSRNEWYLYESGKMPQELVAVLPKGHRLCSLPVCPAAEIAKEPIISLLETSNHDVRRALDAVGAKPDIRFRTKDDYAVIAMVRQGLGVSIMPSLLLRGNNEGVELRPLDPPAYRTIALTMGSVETGPAARQFAEFAKAWVKENA